jgi:hypothetical protein
MKYFILTEAGPAIECHYNSESHLVLEMENLSPVADYPVQFVPWRRDSSTRPRRFEKPICEEC